jgi:hypothetical protein
MILSSSVCAKASTNLHPEYESKCECSVVIGANLRSSIVALLLTHVIEAYKGTIGGWKREPSCLGCQLTVQIQRQRVFGAWEVFYDAFYRIGEGTPCSGGS